MIKSNQLIIFTVLFFITTKVIGFEKAYIIYKIDNKIITNIDVINETRYLIALSPPLKTLESKQLQDVSRESLIKETIKKKEIARFFVLNKNNESLDKFIQDLYLRLGLNNMTEFEEYLEKNQLSMSKIREKIEIETLWNRLIYKKYSNQLNINKKLLREQVVQQENFENIKRYKLLEIVFKKNKSLDQTNQLAKIMESINEIGFKNTATLYSISDNAKFGGDIGWVEETSISKKIQNTLSGLDIGDFTNIIEVGANLMLLKIDDIQIEKKIKNIEEEFQKIIQLERNKRLEQFSKIYFDKIRINTIINEL